MKLVKIDGYWINPESICAVYKDERFTNIEIVNRDKPFRFPISIEKVAQAIEGSEEHLDEVKYLQLKSEIDDLLGTISSLSTVIDNLANVKKISPHGNVD